MSKCNEIFNRGGNFCCYCTRPDGHAGKHAVSAIKRTRGSYNAELLPPGTFRVVASIEGGRETSTIVELARADL